MTSLTMMKGEALDTPPHPPARLFDLSGRVALVTGSSRGLGFAMARALGAAGARVVLNGRDPATLEPRRAQMAGWGLKAETAPFNVSDAIAARDAIKGIVDRYGRLDILISNAGGITRKPLLEQTDDDWSVIIADHLTASYRLAREAARPMVEAGRGRIIVTSSVMGQIARPTVTSYVAAKHGLNGLTRALAVELAPLGVTANAIAPGYFPTEGNRSHRAADSGFADRMAQRTPMGRWGDPDELGAAAIYLASDAAAYVTGQILTVDGGLTASI